ncbi:TFIIS_C domain-containing protein/RNA_POL_M_15KD domain-containing protein [Cephalotus follicularis]|uniref:TFIIS_C domain-containing protein/RNA_POL_M_15KD domain-containing protein n=1 Tax=Cephalotus follicularis TaxID=3775 RepID=A0A1Q3BSI6_CEPFO|nr:TFIIS_C domain-containing protein/RNA_POL_M_15KD domain-containing protein [Cephalotus follicularis]
MSIFKFCPQCNNILYPKEDKVHKLLLYACRNCDHQEVSNNYCVYRNEVHHSVDEYTQVVQDVASDPTLPRTKSVRCTKCGHGEAVFLQVNFLFSMLFLNIVHYYQYHHNLSSVFFFYIIIFSLGVYSIKLASFLFFVFCFSNNILYPKEDREQKILLYACRNCDHQEMADNNCVYRNEVHHTAGERTQVLQDVAADPTLPRTKSVRCARCDHGEAVFFQATARGEEGMTLFFVCCNPNCNYRWRE